MKTLLPLAGPDKLMSCRGANRPGSSAGKATCEPAEDGGDLTFSDQNRLIWMVLVRDVSVPFDNGDPEWPPTSGIKNLGNPHA